MRNIFRIPARVAGSILKHTKPSPAQHDVRKPDLINAPDRAGKLGNDTDKAS